MRNENNFLIKTEELTKVYRLEGEEVVAVDRVNLKVNEGELLAIMGPSGSGKSTLMNLLGCLDTPTAGTYFLKGQDVSKLSDDELAEIRNRRIGFVFQTFNLLPRATALHNVELPLIYSRVSPKERRERAFSALESVGLADRANHRPNELSGGQRQRVAIARALVTKPAIILADEPTGNLDSKASEELMELFLALNEQGNTIIIVTHEHDIARKTRRIIHLLDGKITGEERLS
ncbi:MAG: ABC transporter ATP-binding protein [Acidobacteria bacterium]|nr:ABC transporter ATP-binding protein [Acidobacteriota bacterium]